MPCGQGGGVGPPMAVPLAVLTVPSRTVPYKPTTRAGAPGREKFLWPFPVNDSIVLDPRCRSLHLSNDTNRLAAMLADRCTIEREDGA